MEQRDYFFDNVKAVLIFFVVLGHFLLPIHGDSYLVVVKRLIYVFHMPLFVFVSGYFATRIYKHGKYNFAKLLYLLKAYIFFVLAIQVIYALCGFRSFFEINFLSQSGAPWYLFAMIVWYLCIPFVKDKKPVAVISVCVLLALLAGYDQSIGDFLCLSRILVFSPFFFLGYYMDEEIIKKALHVRFKPAVTMVGAGICFLILYCGKTWKDELGMVYENISYYQLDSFETGALVRFLLMIAAFFISWMILMYVPHEKTKFSYIGQYTMPIYMIHRLIRDLIMFSGVYDVMKEREVEMFLLCVMVSVLLIYLLANEKIAKSFQRLFG